MERQRRPTLPRRAQRVNRPGTAGGWVTAHMLGGKAVKQRVLGRVHRHQLALKMGGQLGDGQALRCQLASWPVTSSQQVWLSAAWARSNTRASQVGICTPL